MNNATLCATWESFADDELFGDSMLGDVLPDPSGGRGPVTFGPEARLRIDVYLALGADLTAAPSSWTWTQIPSDLVRYSTGITCSTGRLDESGTVGAGSGSLTFDNRDGRFSRKNPTGPYYGRLTRNTPILVQVDAGNGAHDFMQQYVNEWPHGFDKTQADFTVPIRTAGILRRLGNGATPDESPMRRAILGDDDLVQYWPCEDGEDSNTLASALGVGSAMGLVGTVTPGSSTATGLGTDPLPVLATGTTYLKGSTSMASSQTWTYGATYYFTSVPVWTSGDGLSYLLYVPANTAGSLVRWLVYWNNADDTIYLEVRSNSAVIATVAGPVLTNAEMIDCWLTFWVSASQSGADVNYVFGVERATATTVSSSATSGTIAAQTVYQVDGMLVFNGKSAATTTVGHVFVLSRALTSTQNTPCYRAINAYTGETATTRITRLCTEAGIALELVNAQGEGASMGPQSRSSLLSVLRDCESADGGVLYEVAWGLGYQPLNARYNQEPALRLDITQGHLAEVPAPTDDDQRLRNIWTVSRTSGSSFTASDEDSVTAEGEHPDSATLDLEADIQCDQVATWLVHLGTQDEIRWARISLRFDKPATTGLILPWITMGFGERILIAHPPDSVMPTGNTLDLIVEGRSQRVDQFTWTADINTSPGQVYEVLMLNDPLRGRLSIASTLAAAIDSDDTALSVAITNTAMGNLWTTTQVPFDVAIGGERMTVTAVSGTSSPQTFTVTRSVNGVVKSHAAHTAAAPVRVRLWNPPVLSR